MQTLGQSCEYTYFYLSLRREEGVSQPLVIGETHRTQADAIRSGPIIGGITSDPAANYPSLFGGIAWLEKFPYALPNLISAVFLTCAAIGVFFGLEEVNSLTQKDHLLNTDISRRTNNLLNRKTSASPSDAKSPPHSQASSRRPKNPLTNPSSPPQTPPSPSSHRFTSPKNALHHATRTNSPSIESSPTTSSAPSSATVSWPAPWAHSNQSGIPSSRPQSTTLHLPPSTYHQTTIPTSPSSSQAASVFLRGASASPWPY